MLKVIRLELVSLGRGYVRLDSFKLGFRAIKKPWSDFSSSDPKHFPTKNC